MGLVISLCDFTGNMVRPWLEAGHSCVIVDTKHPAGVTVDGKLRKYGYRVEDIAARFDVSLLSEAIVFAFPPCTDVAVSGARHFQAKGLKALIASLQTLASCVSVCEQSKAWMLENPVSTFSTYWRKPDHTFHPYQYASASDNYSEEMYSKKTCLWTGGLFVMPPKRDIFNANPYKIHYLGSAGQEERSVTPLGFAYAVYEANKHLFAT